MVIVNKCSTSVSIFCFLVLVVLFFFVFLRRVITFSIDFVYSLLYSAALQRAGIMREPVVTRETVSGENSLLRYGCSWMQGWRSSMEDAHTLFLESNVACFGVFDGHGGAFTAKYCASNLHKMVMASEAFRSNDVVRALHDGFINLDKQLYQTNCMERSGSTAVVLCICNNTLYCANAGDSRCVLCRNGEAFPLSNDHKPYLLAEENRIQRAGSYVYDRRVNGILALSRAIGDFRFKTNTVVPWEEQAVTCVPEVISTPLQPGTDSFVVLACDGIWDVMSSEDVVQFVKRRLRMDFSLETIAVELILSCLSSTAMGRGTDNMSVIIIQFKDGAIEKGSASIAPDTLSSRM